MNKRRRTLLKTAGIVLLPTAAGCTEQADGGGNGDDEQGSNSGYGGGADGETETATPTDPETETRTQSETETRTQSETDTQTQSETETATETAGSPSTSALVIDNVGFEAWEVTEDESGSVAPLNEENPTLSFEVGRRYAVENRGWSSHPFALRAADDAPLLSQSADGRFENDDAVDWTDDGETLAFTFTDELAAAVDYYICTVHSGMRGDVEAG